MANWVYDKAGIDFVCNSVMIENIFGNEIVVSSIFGWKNKNTLIISENATFKDYETKTIYQSEDWKFVSVKSDVADE